MDFHIHTYIYNSAANSGSKKQKCFLACFILKTHETIQKPHDKGGQNHQEHWQNPEDLILVEVGRK